MRPVSEPIDLKVCGVFSYDIRRTQFLLRQDPSKETDEMSGEWKMAAVWQPPSRQLARSPTMFFSKCFTCLSRQSKVAIKVAKSSGAFLCLLFWWWWWWKQMTPIIPSIRIESV